MKHTGKKFIVHSDINENNIYKEFDDYTSAFEYALDNIEDYTFLDSVEYDDTKYQHYSEDPQAESENLWNYAQNYDNYIKE